MGFSYACLMLQRVLMPTVLVLAALFRPVGISFVYLLMFFISPFVPIATTRNFKGSVTAYLIILIALSTIVILCHIALQVTIIAFDVKSTFGLCSFTEQLLRHVGFIDFRGLKALAIVEWLAPEVIVFVTSLAVYLVTKRLTVQSVPGQLEAGEVDASLQQFDAADSRPTSGGAPNAVAPPDKPDWDKLIKISPLFCLATLFFAAVLRPSVPGGFYFLIFLLSGSYWATFQTLKRGFALLLRCVMAVIVLQTVSIVAYQTPYMQMHLQSDQLAARLLGLEPLITSSCDNDIRIIVYNTDYKADSFINPFVLFFTFYALALTTKNLIKPRIIEKTPVSLLGQQIQHQQQQQMQPSQSQQLHGQHQEQQPQQQQQQQQSQTQLENGNNKLNRQLSLMAQTSRGSKKDSWSRTTQQRLNVSLRRDQRPMTITEPNETTPLVRHSGRKNRTEVVGRNTAALTPSNDIPLDSRSIRSNYSDQGEDEVNASLFDQICYGIVSVGGFIYQNSYIFTNILMMAWSIVYHSWLTFVLLLWANVLWMIPNQRKAMMRSSPFIVIYAELLVIAQYIYGMDLNNDELPSTVKTTGINLSQIGLERPQENGMQPCVPLIVKTSFLLMFWVTLRQFFKEKSDRRPDSTGAVDIIAPLHRSGSAGTLQSRHADNKKTSKFLKKAGDIIKNLLVRLWIWLLVLVIFLCAITGKDMTGFRICYMALFLFFLLVFQSSSSVWVKVMYGFWLFLIFYAMSILILIYTYQFDKFDQYWNDYLNISKTLQTDIGLERYKTKDLFLHLVSPTIIVILTVIQVHYFHRRFIASLQPVPLEEGAPRAHTPSQRTPVPRVAGAPAPHLSETEPQNLLDPADFERSVRDLVRKGYKRVKSRVKRNLSVFKDIFWRFLELHIIKAVYITAFVCCVSEVCVLHTVFMILCIVGATSRKSVQVFISRIISFIVTIIILSKMIYQVAYLDHSRYNVECNNSKEIQNNAEWFGYKKASPDTGGLMGLLRNYIIYMVMVTLHAVVSLRQFQMRNIYEPLTRVAPAVLFPNITREHAEVNLIGMVKYLFNYGFYKFGMEITLICLVSTITYRQDIVAVAYALWLFVLLLADRAKCAKIWGILLCFVGTSIFLQYLVLVALPPSLCIRYPWLDSKYSEAVQRWAMLPGDLHLEHVSKLVFDFFLLMIIHRQKRVFSIETRPGSYPGGSNKSVIKDIANLGQVQFDNPTHDFTSLVRNYLDVFKNGILSSFYWITLAVVFLAGTNIADLLALGYLIGAFVFLWEGSDFYLRPINVIIRRWNFLITYNVANIVIKTCLQMAGCIFLEELTQNCCWFVHMFGISCTSKPFESVVPTDEPLSSDECPTTATHIALLWDAVCFAFLLLQMRIFKSHYFCHIIVDTKANSILASRGAEIIEDLRRKQIEHRQGHEQEVLLKIKRKMEKIRATQQKMLKPIDKPTHFDEQGYPVPGSRAYKRKEVKLHPQAVRAGDYYMFEDVDDKFELDLIEDEVDFLEDEDKITQSEKKINRRKTLIDVWKDIQGTENRRKLYVRQRSYASAPGSRIGIKIDDELDVGGGGGDAVLGGVGGGSGAGIGGGMGLRASTYSEPLEYAVCDYLMEQSRSGDQADTAAPSTSREATSEEPSSEKKSKPDVELEEKDSDDDIEANPIVRLLEGFLVSLTMRLNRFSRNYRYVNKILVQEKKNLKESNTVHRLARHGTAAMFSGFKRHLDSSDDDGENGPNTGSRNGTTNNTTTPMYTTPSDTNTSNNLPPSPPQAQMQSQDVQSPPPPPPQPQDPHVVDIIATPFDTVDARDPRQEGSSSNTLTRGRRPEPPGLPEIRIKGPSCDRSHDGSGSLSKQWSYDKVDSVADFHNFEEEDFTTRDHNIIIEVLIAAWYAILSNTDLICYIVVFIYQVVNASIISLPLPIMVFLWGTLSLPRPTKTFWVTLIAYTQACVLIKCVFQFKLIWANYINLPNQPLALAKIFGVELDPNYASYDLLLLLVLFFHRFILKTQGLWKSEYNEAMQLRSRSESKLTITGPDTDNQESSQGLVAVMPAEQQQQPPSDEGSDKSQPPTGEGGEPNYNDLIKKRLERSSYFASVKKFFTNMVKKSRLPADVYALMFLCDFINFFVLLFGFTAFGSQQAEGDGGVQTYLAENKVPIPFLIMLLVQFILIVIDRALYLRKALVYKIIFHFLSVVGIHIWMFFVVPAVTERSFYSLAPPIIFYIIKCFYMLLSSYQIKCGYPKRILGNFLTKGFSMANMIAFKVYMQMPFLYELRTILDWVSTDTTMTLFDWLKMEDIFSDIFFIKCSRQLETDFPAIRAQKKALFSKLMMGGTVILLIVVSIWGPLCLFALGNAVGQPNVPYEVSVSIRIGPYDPIYSTNNRESIFTFNEKMFNDMRNTYIKDKSAFTFLSNYDAEDVAAVKLAANSPSMWAISPPDKERLLSDLINNVTLVARFTYTLTRVPPAKGLSGSVGDEVTFAMNSTFPGRNHMINMLNGTGDTSETVVLPDLLPKFIKVLNLGDTGLVNQLMPSNEKYRPLVIKFNNKAGTNDMWWEIRDFCSDNFHDTTLSKLPFVNCDGGIVMYTFNDKKFPSTFSFLTAGGIIGLYTTFVLLASRFLKSFIAGQNRKIMFEDLPYVDRVLQLCLDIYLVREALEFALEEDLFAKLIFLYRSPETMIKWTRPKEETAEDETDTESVRSRNSGRRSDRQDRPE